MTDMLLDDVNSLLDGDFGDDRILKQIARACKNNEVISNYERNYVKKLAEQYLGRKPDVVPSTTPENPPSITPAVIIPKIESSAQTTTFQSSNTHNSQSSLKNSKLILGLGIASLIIIVAAVMFSSNNDSVTPNPISEIKNRITQYRLDSTNAYLKKNRRARKAFDCLDQFLESEQEFAETERAIEDILADGVFGEDAC